MSADLPDWIREKLPAKSGPADVIQIIDPNDLKGLDEGQLTQIAAVNNILEPSGLIRDVSIALNSSIRAQGEALEVEKTSSILGKLPQSPTRTASNAIKDGALRKTTSTEKGSSTFNKIAGFLRIFGIDIGEPRDTKYTKNETRENLKGKVEAYDPSVRGGKKKVHASYSSHSAAGAGFDDSSSVTITTNEKGSSSKLKGRGVIGARTVVGSASGSSEEPSVRGGKIIYKNKD